MTSNKPYILRALFEWILDNDLTPYLLVNELIENVMVPEGISNDNKIVFNLSPSAIRELELLNEAVLFSARFHGRPENVYLPMNAILGIYANENGEGMMFPEEAFVEAPLGISEVESKDTKIKKSKVKKTTSKKPSLTIV